MTYRERFTQRRKGRRKGRKEEPLFFFAPVPHRVPSLRFHIDDLHNELPDIVKEPEHAVDYDERGRGGRVGSESQQLRNLRDARAHAGEGVNRDGLGLLRSVTLLGHSPEGFSTQTGEGQVYRSEFVSNQDQVSVLAN